MLHEVALYRFTIDIDIDTDALLAIATSTNDVANVKRHVTESR